MTISPRDQGQFWDNMATVERVTLAHEAEQLIAELLARESIVGRDVLDCGCGTGDHGAVFARLGARRVVGIDVSQASLQQARTLIPAGNVALASLSHLPFRDGSFHVIWAWGVLHYVPDAIAGLHEMARLLRPGGMMVIHTVRRGLWSALENGAARILSRAPYRVQSAVLAVAERALPPLVRLVTGHSPAAHTAKTLRQKLRERLFVPGRLHSFARGDIAAVLGSSFDVHEVRPAVPDLLKRDMSITVVAVRERLMT